MVKALPEERPSDEEEQRSMKIRTFQKGDEPVQAALYNEAARALPKFKPATALEVQRRTSARDFDPGMRYFAEDQGQPVGYCLFNTNGRVSYPWCRPGFEHCAEPLFTQVLNAMKDRDLPLAFAAYRPDWAGVKDFFLGHEFTVAREMINFAQDIVEMPTVASRASSSVTSARREDVPAILRLVPEALRVKTPEALEDYLFRNPYMTPESLSVLRSKMSSEPLALGILITEPTYADPRNLDPLMPCFRLGAFGTELMQAKRVKGLFSVLARNDAHFPVLALDLLGHASFQVQDSDDVEVLAAQVPSDVPHLLRFYERHFRRQGGFPVFERPLAG
jgi:hypothetical protein